jgi:hypothetical protein
MVDRAFEQQLGLTLSRYAVERFDLVLGKHIR